MLIIERYEKMTTRYILDLFIIKITWDWDYIKSVGRLFEFVIWFPWRFPWKLRWYILYEIDNKRFKINEISYDHEESYLCWCGRCIRNKQKLKEYKEKTWPSSKYVKNPYQYGNKQYDK